MSETWPILLVTRNPRLAAAPGANKFEIVMVDALLTWSRYGQVHKEKYGSHIGDDGVLGPAWFAWGKALEALLNGELGRLDGNTCWQYINQTLKRGGYAEGLESE